MVMQKRCILFPTSVHASRSLLFPPVPEVCTRFGNRMQRALAIFSLSQLQPTLANTMAQISSSSFPPRSSDAERVSAESPNEHEISARFNLPPHSLSPVPPSSLLSLAAKWRLRACLILCPCRCPPSSLWTRLWTQFTVPGIQT